MYENVKEMCKKCASQLLLSVFGKLPPSPLPFQIKLLGVLIALKCIYSTEYKVN